MVQDDDFLGLDDKGLLAQCDQHVYRSSGPGGQHRNKVSSAVRLRHRPTGISAHGDDSRSQHDNRRLALRRLRMNIACRQRRPINRSGPVPPFLAECMFRPRGGPGQGRLRLQVGVRDHRFWRVAAFVLDALEAFEGSLSDAASFLGITTANVSSMLKSHCHLFAAAQALRSRFGLRPLS